MHGLARISYICDLCRHLQDKAKNGIIPRGKILHSYSGLAVEIEIHTLQESSSSSTGKTQTLITTFILTLELERVSFPKFYWANETGALGSVSLSLRLG